MLRAVNIKTHGPAACDAHVCAMLPPSVARRSRLSAVEFVRAKSMQAHYAPPANIPCRTNQIRRNPAAAPAPGARERLPRVVRGASGASSTSAHCCRSPCSWSARRASERDGGIARAIALTASLRRACGGGAAAAAQQVCRAVIRRFLLHARLRCAVRASARVGNSLTSAVPGGGALRVLVRRRWVHQWP